MRSDAAHRVHRDRATDHLRVLAAVRVGPALRQRDCLVECGLGEFARESADRFGRYAARFGDAVRRVLVGHETLGEQLERRHHNAPVSERVFADDQGSDVDRIRAFYAPTSREIRWR